jgi:hypothetical protein
LRDELRELVDTARALDAELYPAAGAVRMPRSSSMQALRDRAQAVLTAIGPIKAAFVEMDWAADFDETFAELIAAYDTATLDQTEGRYDQVAGTAGLTSAAQAGVKAVRTLDAIMKKRLKSDAGLLAAGKRRRTSSAARRGSRRKPAAPLALAAAVESGAMSVERRWQATSRRKAPRHVNRAQPLNGNGVMLA